MASRSNRHQSQIDMRVAPTAETHVVRYKDMVEYVEKLSTESVRVVLTEPFVGTYDTTNLTLTQTAPEVLEIDGVTVVSGDRILVTEQLDRTQNGIYVVTVEGTVSVEAVLTRAADFNESTKIKNGLIVPVTEGDDNGGSKWRTIVSAVAFVLDNSNILFEKDVVDMTKVVEQTFAITGNGAETEYTFNHGWNTRHITHELYDAAGVTVVGVFRRIDANNVAVEFGVPLENGETLTLVIRAEVNPI